MQRILNLKDLSKLSISLINSIGNSEKQSSIDANLISFEGITAQSKHVCPGFLFIAEKGVSKDGHQFITQAISKGATGLLVEKLELVPCDFKGHVFYCSNTRATSSHLASFFYEKPSEKLFCIGVTGTNGKTSITYLIEHFFNLAQMPTGVVGTINHHLGQKIWPTEMTTPHPIELQGRLRNFLDEGAKTLAIEVSSHALDQNRIASIQFDVGIFTNLTQDHLDYHSTMQKYFQTKERFFSEILPASNKKNLFAIVNDDDPWGKKIVIPNPIQKWTYGKSNNADLNFKLLSMDFSGTIFNINTPYGSLSLKSPLIGVHNIYNVLGSIGAALSSGIQLHKIKPYLLEFEGVPGRLQRVPNASSLSVLIDYAHSPDALENVLSSLQIIRDQSSTRGRIICIFGCGGDRDKGKRPLMAQIAEKYSDIVIVTSDNPRTEDPLVIIDEIKVGFTQANSPKLFFEPDRQKAIEKAVNEAKPEDVVLIAGKGHENYQIIGNEKFYFSDYETVRKLIE